jgi:glyoxylase-like metal-dependent hydrolase (beta-lactamase superfamily II)
MGSGNAWRGKWVGHCLLVETERDGLVLVDTGFGTRDVSGETGLSAPARVVGGLALSREETAIAQVSALGYKAGDVKHIVVTHLDLDHAGGLVDFPHAKVHVHAREHAAAMTRKSYKERLRYIKAHFAHGPKWEVYTEDGDTWRGLPAVTRLRGLDVDIGLLPMHGHTRGHSAVIVRSPGLERGEFTSTREEARWLVHAGDAYFHHNAIEGSRKVPPGVAAFEFANEMIPAARRASVAALRELAASYRDLDLFCAHDEREYMALRGRA